MAPRTRKVMPKEKTIFFYDGITEEQIIDFLKRNNLKKDDCMISLEKEKSFVQVPEDKEYIVPDETYIWLKDGYV